MKPKDEYLSDSEAWDKIFAAAETLYAEYLNITTFDDLLEMAKTAEPEPMHVPNYDVPMTIQCEHNSK